MRVAAETTAIKTDKLSHDVLHKIQLMRKNFIKKFIKLERNLQSLLNLTFYAVLETKRVIVVL